MMRLENLLCPVTQIYDNAYPRKSNMSPKITKVFESGRKDGCLGIDKRLGP
jgi:hypothetical protein